MKSHLLSPILLASAFFLLSHIALAADSSLSTGQVEQVKNVVHDYLVTNPQVLVEASQSLQKQEMQKMEQQAKDTIIKQANTIFDDPNSPLDGNHKGTVTLVEFFDYQCPHCKEMKPLLEKLAAWNSNLRIVYKELPIFGANSKDAASAALAAAKQGADSFLKLHNALLLASNPLSKDKVLEIAKSIGINVEKLSKDMQDSGIQKQLEDNLQLAQALNLAGTPSFIISKWEVGSKTNAIKNPSFIPGATSLDDFKAKIEAAQKSNP